MSDVIAQILEIEDAELDARWRKVQAWLSARFQREPGIESILFLIGIQSRGEGYKPKLRKESKQELIMEGACCAFETLGLYQSPGVDAEGKRIWEQVVPAMPRLPVAQQEKLLKLGILHYFEPILQDAAQQQG